MIPKAETSKIELSTTGAEKTTPKVTITVPTECEKFKSIRTDFLLAMRKAGFITDSEFNANR